MEYSKTMLFSEYYENWIAIYKEGAIRETTMMKYKTASDGSNSLLLISL